MTHGSVETRSRDLRAYWRANRLLIAVLLVIWAVVSYGCSILFIEQLNQFTLGELPLGFWFAQQGSIVTFVLLVLIYALVMDVLDRKHGFGPTQPPAGTDNPPAEAESGEEADDV